MELQDNPEVKALDHAEWLGLLLDREVTQRKDRKLKSRRRCQAPLAQACVEDLDLKATRGLDRRLMAELSACNWIREHHNLFLTGPCGTGKTWLACALGQQAARSELCVLSRRVPGSSLISPSPTATVVIPACFARSVAPICSSSTTGDQNP